MSAADKFLTPGNMKADLPVLRTVSAVLAGQGSEVEVARKAGGDRVRVLQCRFSLRTVKAQASSASTNTSFN